MSLTKLDAINICLRGIGISPVATEDDPDLDAALASQTIDDVSFDIQSRGWWFNREGNWKLTPDEITGYISAPGSALSIIPTGQLRGAGLTIRGTKIYDMHNHTFDLRSVAVSDNGVSYIEFIFITELPFNDLPPIAKQAITYTARRLFAQDLELDDKRWKFQKEDENMAHTQLMREETKNKKRNSLTDNPQVANFMANAGGINARSNLYSLGFPKRNEI